MIEHTLDIIEEHETKSADGLRNMAWYGTNIVQWVTGTGNVVELLEMGDGGQPQVRTSAEVIKFPVRIQRKASRRSVRPRRRSA